MKHYDNMFNYFNPLQANDSNWNQKQFQFLVLKIQILDLDYLSNLLFC